MDSENFISAAEFARRMSYFCSQSLWVNNDSDSMLLFPERIMKRCKESPAQIDWGRISVKEASQKQKDLTAGANYIICADDVPVLYLKVNERQAYWMPDVEELSDWLSYMTVFDIADRVKQMHNDFYNMLSAVDRIDALVFCNCHSDKETMSEIKQNIEKLKEFFRTQLEDVDQEYKDL